MDNRIRVAVLILEKDKILLLKHTNPKNKATSWVPPGGGLQDDEDIFECAKREVWEETNLKVKIDKIVYIRQFINYYSSRNNLEIYLLAKTYEGLKSTKNLKGMGGDEHFIKELKFFSKDDIKKIKAYPEILYGEFWDDLKKGFPGIKFLGVQENDEEKKK
jgi:8-oxo-dGTP diphosphatase